MARAPIVFDFVRNRTYRGDATESLAAELTAKASKAAKPRVVKTVVGVPPGILTQPKR